jgi:hypothetical protein
MTKKNIAILLFALMFGGLFWSRAVLSITQGAWLLFALVSYRAWKPSVTRDPLMLWSICPLLLFVLGYWQQPFQAANYDYLLTLTAYPVTALAVRSFSITVIKKYWLKIWAWATLVGLLYPLLWYLLHITGSNKAYGMGQSLSTFMDTDHVRFSIFLCSSFLFALIFRANNSLQKKIITGALFLIIVFLSVRTAWVILFIIIICFIICNNEQNRRNNMLRAVKVFVFVACLSATAYYIFPTVHQKIAYTVYDWQQYKPGTYDSNYSDGARRAINYTAWQAVTHANGSNIGWAGIPNTLQQFFAKSFPGAVLNYGWPFNQFLFWWMGSGWWGMLLFTAWLLYPLYWGWKHQNKGLVCWTVAIAVSCLAECTLTLQYGVWLHAWPLAILWRFQKSKNECYQ